MTTKEREEAEVVTACALLNTNEGRILIAVMKRATSFDEAVFRPGDNGDPCKAAVHDGGRQAVGVMLKLQANHE